jgi:hypothetical protein
VGASHRPGLQLRHDVVGLLVPDADGGQGLEDRELCAGGLVLVVADAGQLLAVHVGVRLLGAHAVPPLSVRVRWAAQFGLRTGVGVRVSVAGVRMMRRLVRGAVTAWTRTTTACRPAPPRTLRPGEADLIGRPVAQTPLRTQPPEQRAGRERGGHGDDDAHHQDHRIPIADSSSIRSGVSVAARLRWFPIQAPSLCSRSSWHSPPTIRSTHFLGTRRWPSRS